MRRRAARRRAFRGDEEVSMLPVINLFVILVPFLVATATSGAISTYNLDVPAGTSGAAGEMEEELVLTVVRIFPDSFVAQNTAGSGFEVSVVRGPDRAASLAELEEVLEQIRATFPAYPDILLAPAPTVSYGEVIEVMERGQNVGLVNVSLGSLAGAEEAAGGGGSGAARPGDPESRGSGGAPEGGR